MTKSETGKATKGRNDTDKDLVTIRPAVLKPWETMAAATSHAVFVGPGMTFEVAGQALKSSLVYVATGQARSLSEPSLIDLALPVAASKRIDATEPPNLPSYLEATGTQRRRGWDQPIAGSKTAPIIDAGGAGGRVLRPGVDL